jgi:hypothetical protein
VKKRFTEEQIIGFLREAETGLPVAELCLDYALPEPTAQAALRGGDEGLQGMTPRKRLFSRPCKTHPPAHASRPNPWRRNKA